MRAEMAKRFKIRFSRVFPAFRSFRSNKHQPSLPESPLPGVFRLSPVNPKTIDIDFPTRAVLPTNSPAASSLKRHMSSYAVSIGCGCRSKPKRRAPSSGRKDNSGSPGASSEFQWKRDQKWHVASARRKVVYTEEDTDVSLEAERGKQRRKQHRIKKGSGSGSGSRPRPRTRFSTSSGESGWFSSEDYEYEAERQMVVSPQSFSSDTSLVLEPVRESYQLARRHKRLKRVKMGKRKTRVVVTPTCPASPETDTPASVSLFRRLIPCSLDGKVRESFAVVKRSEDPYEDFRRSMLEMILEKQMFEARDLEQLLHCFLSLNARAHHGVIVQVFSDIWDALFCKSPKLFPSDPNRF